MQYTAIISLLAATGALAAPSYYGKYEDSSKGSYTTSAAASTYTESSWSNTGAKSDVTITLGGASELATTLQLQSTFRNEAAPVISGPFNTLLVSIDASAENQALRCQALDQYGQPIIGNRGANRDITFAGGAAGAWTFDAAYEVSKVICDPAFVKRDASEFPKPSATYTSAVATATATGAAAGETLSVLLSTQATEEAITRQLPAGVQTSDALNGQTVWETVALTAPAGSTERCKILDVQGNAIIVLRGANRDITFADGQKGEWKLETPSAVTKIICDPAFVAQKL